MTGARRLAIPALVVILALAIASTTIVLGEAAASDTRERVRRAQIDLQDRLAQKIADDLVSAISSVYGSLLLGAPIFGTGIYTTYMRGPEITAKAATETNKRHKEGMSRHAHNVFLQTWFELGLVGAVLLLLTGLAVLNKIAGLSERLQPFALASFTSVLALMSSSYGMWQNWFLALFALTPVFFAIGARLLDGDIRSRTSS